jgi:hypothetical protein
MQIYPSKNLLFIFNVHHKIKEVYLFIYVAIIIKIVLRVLTKGGDYADNFR